MNKFTSTWAVVVSVIILLALKVYNPIPLQTLQLKTFDLYQKFGNNYQSKSLVLIDISDNSLNLYGQWPWKRDQLGRAIIKAYQNGAALVFLNVVFVHKDRLGGDEMFLKMISKYPVILTETKDAKNLQSIKRKVLGVGDVLVPVDVDGTIRKLPLKNSVPETILKIIKFKIPKQDDIWIDFRHQIPRIDHAELDWSSVKGKIVFIGATFSGSTYVLTPDGLKNPHDIMAMSTETLLSGKYIQRPDWLPKLEWIGFILGLLAFVLIIPRVGLLWSAVLLFGAYADIALGSAYLWHSKMIITDWSYIAIAITIVWSHLIYNNFARENRLKLQIKKQFEHYLEPKMVKKLQQNPDLLKLGGETKELTFLFCDIRGFTPLSEKYQKNPAELTKVINRFLTPMTEIIMRNGGTIDKYMGDCIMAFWNAPIDTPKHKELAITSALEMMDKLDYLNNMNGFGDQNKINIGIGINTGKCIVGNMGSKQRFDYSVIGDPVNLASRLEGVSKNYDATLVVGEDTYRDISTLYNFKLLDEVQVKGKSNKVSIYTIERENGLRHNKSNTNIRTSNLV
jgi:class 3 adenylate cyclase/CHASE2 domain-containing sensor protein